MSTPALAAVSSLKVKLGLLVVVSSLVAAVVGSVGRVGGVPVWLGVPVTVLVALAVTQLLALGMVAPLREMTQAARLMASGGYDVRVQDTGRDEVGELARAFNTMARDLAVVDQQRRDLVATVSHELRTPLAGLCAVLDNLVDGVAPDDPARLTAARDQAERLARLVSDLLDLARVDAGRAPITTRPVVLSRLLEGTVAEAQLLATVLGRDVEFAVRLDPPDLVVQADADRLRQLVANLLDNAVRHSPVGGTVTVSGTTIEDRYVLDVRDEGPGVPAEHRGRLFERFGTLDATGGGTGLGLAIARWVAELHGGSARFEEPGPSGGALVRADLPLRPPARATGGRSRDAAVVPEASDPETVVPETSDPTPPPSRSDLVPTASARHATAPPTGSVAAVPLTDDVFGGFWPERGVPARLPLLLGAAAVGVLAAVVLPFRDVGLGFALVLGAAGAVVLTASRYRRDPFTQACAVLCGLAAAVAAVRDADWIVALCVLAGAGLCVVGVTRARTLRGFLLSGLSWPLAGLRGLPWLGRTLGTLTGSGRGAALLRTVLWSGVGLLVFGALFVSADALVARWVDALLPDLTADTLVLRAFVTLAVGGAVLAAAYLALNPPAVDGESRPARPVTRRFEWLAPVLVVDAVFALFLVAQAAVLFGGEGYLRRTTGLTYAAYVHQGFGQLTVATALTLLVLWAAGRKAPRATSADRRWLRASLGLLCLLTLAVVGSALYRMALYQQAYGFTRLRLLVDVFEGWLGLIVLATMVGGALLRTRWLPRFAVLSGAVALLGLAAVNPDAWIARHNLERYAETGRVDLAYLAGLSDDAVPALTASEELADCVLAGRNAAADDLFAWNLGRARAAALLPPPETPDPTTVPACPQAP